MFRFEYIGVTLHLYEGHFKMVKERFLLPLPNSSGVTWPWNVGLNRNLEPTITAIGTCEGFEGSFNADSKEP